MFGIAAATAITTGLPTAASAMTRAGADPTFALIAQHRALRKACEEAFSVSAELYFETIPEAIRRPARVQYGMKRGKPFYLYSHEQIDQVIYWSALFERKAKVSAELHAEFTRDESDLSVKKAEHGVTAADERVEQLRRASDEIAWALATRAPTSAAGVAAVLRYANEYEDDGDNWNIDTVQSEEWHYQLRQTAAKALETLIS